MKALAVGPKTLAASHSPSLRLLRTARPSEVRRRGGIDEATRRILLYGVLPTWIGAGLADWWHHRRTGIERTSGPLESAIHLVMMAEAGVPTLLGLFSEVDAGVLAAALGGIATHEATAYWDVSFAQPRRRVTPGEQQIHSLLEVVPMAATALLIAQHWDQALALVGRGEREPDLRLRPKERPLSGRQKAAAIGAIIVFGALPYAEELVRCVRASRRRETETDS